MDTNSVAQCKNLISQGCNLIMIFLQEVMKSFVNLFALIVSIYSFISLARGKINNLIN